jgi:eukaryotic-like serine/threonine-protein kinase
MTHVGIGYSYVDFSSDGTLLYAPVDAASSSLELVLTDRKGVSTSLSRRRGEFVDPVLSPDGQQLVVGIGESRATDLWLVNIARDSWSRIAPEGQSLAPVWSPRGDRIFYSSNRAGTYNIYSMPANGQGPVTQITNREYWPFTRSVSADGRTLIMEVQHPVTSNDLWLVDLATHKESPLLTSRANEEYGVMSPDGRWFAYASNETGKYEVYVQHLPPTGRKWSVSENGGILPRWSADGREIFFRNDDKVMVAPVRTQPALVIEAPRLLFENEYTADYDVSRDGQHFVMLRGKNRTAHLNVVLNWFEDVRRRVAVAYERRQ